MKINSATQTISCRVPSDIADLFTKSAKSKGITRSTAMAQLITAPNTRTLKKGSVVKMESIPNDVYKQIAVFGGGTAIGLVVYQLLKTYMPRDKYTEDEISKWASILALSAGVLGALGIHSVGDEK